MKASLEVGTAICQYLLIARKWRKALCRPLAVLRLTILTRVSVKCGPDGGGWRMADGGWRMADGGWRVEKCGWKIADDKMRMEKCGR